MRVLTTAEKIKFKGYKEYVGLLTQSGTSAPTEKVLENTLGGSITWGYTSTGIYTATLTGAFTADKTAVYLTGTDASTFYKVVRTSANVITITTTADNDAAPSAVANAKLTDATFVIKVYQN